MPSAAGRWPTERLCRVPFTPFSLYGTVGQSPNPERDPHDGKSDTGPLEVRLLQGRSEGSSANRTPFLHRIASGIFRRGGGKARSRSRRSSLVSLRVRATRFSRI